MPTKHDQDTLKFTLVAIDVLGSSSSTTGLEGLAVMKA